MDLSKDRQRILITGATGCVGQYLTDELLANSPHSLVLIVRDPSKLPAPIAGSGRVEIIQADVADFDSYRDQLGSIDIAMLVAACWGGPDAFRVNVEANLAITDYLAERGGSRVFYFATGSVIDRNLDLLPAARELGSEYIRSKYQLVEEIEKRSDRIDIVGIYPTLIIGGGNGKPTSHFANLMFEVRPWAWLARFFRADAKFHYVHGEDIARSVHYLIDAPLDQLPKSRRVVLGNPAVTANSFLEEYLAYLGYKSPFTIKLRDWLAEWFIRIFRIQVSAWDRYCMEHRDLSYRQVYNPGDFGLPVHCPNLATGLAEIGMKPIR